jgi:hypothetical protein
MTSYKADPFRRRNAILLAVAIFLLLAFVMDFRLLTCLFSRQGLVAQSLIVIGCFAYAYGVRSLASRYLHSPGDPWYTKKGSPLFVAMATFGVNILIEAMGELLTDRNLGSMLVMTLTCTAIELAAIVLIDWPHVEDHPQPEPPTSQQPSSGSPTDGLWREEKR